MNFEKKKLNSNADLNGNSYCLGMLFKIKKISNNRGNTRKNIPVKKAKLEDAMGMNTESLLILA